jgi:hypothetical protein
MQGSTLHISRLTSASGGRGTFDLFTSPGLFSIKSSLVTPFLTSEADVVEATSQKAYLKTGLPVLDFRSCRDLSFPILRRWIGNADSALAIVLS